MPFVSRRKVAAALKPIYRAVNEDAALEALGTFKSSRSGDVARPR